jgi:hypothetical protein
MRSFGVLLDGFHFDECETVFIDGHPEPASAHVKLNGVRDLFCLGFVADVRGKKTQGSKPVGFLAHRASLPVIASSKTGTVTICKNSSA